jgi:benzoyl-CoA reductase/2-hydroxyglutaryl-CoA dehydratase subunit BcrC/BadD/HgdB
MGGADDLRDFARPLRIIESVMSNENAIRGAIQGVVDLHRNRFDLLRAAESPKIGWVSIQTPEEILLAAGVIPFRITGELESATDAGARLSNIFCSYVLSCFSEGLDGIYDFADGVIFTNGCDMRKRLWEAWARDLPRSTSYFLELPSDASDLSKDYFAQQLRKLIQSLERRYGREITEEALRQSIEMSNRSRTLMQRLDEYKKVGLQFLSGEESIQVVKAATTGLKESFNAKMSVLLDTLAAAEQPAARKRHRVMICGSYFDHKGIIDTIEETGADLVCADISNGVKYFEGQIDPGTDPVAAIASYYLEKHTSARRLDTDVRMQHVFDLVREYRVDSIIYYVLKFCDTNLHDYPYIKERLREKKIPVLFIEGERNATNIAGTRTRIQTFLESRMV